MPRPIATAAAIAVTTASTGERRRRESSGTTVCFSARALGEDAIAELRARRRAGRGHRQRPRDLPERGEILLALRTAGEMLLERLPLGRVESVERVPGGQLVDFGFHDPSSAVVEKLTQTREPGEHPALDRTERQSEPLGQLGLREAAVVGELDRLALRVRQLAESLLDALALEAEPRRVLRRLARRRVARLVVERLGSSALLAPDEIDGPPVDERQDPGARLRALGAEAGAPCARPRGMPPARRPRRAGRRGGPGTRGRRRHARRGRTTRPARPRRRGRRERREPRPRDERGACAWTR